MEESLSDSYRKTLVELACWAVESGVHHGSLPSVDISELDAILREKRATFVTLHVHDRLNGCIGMMEAVRPLALDVITNAYGAAFRDPRFPGVSKYGLETLRVDISVLSPLRRVDAPTEKHLLDILEPGKHGLLLQSGDRRGTLLPSVWKEIEDSEEFVRHVKFKARLPFDDWPENIETYVYTVEYFGKD